MGIGPPQQTKLTYGLAHPASIASRQTRRASLRSSAASHFFCCPPPCPPPNTLTVTLPVIWTANTVCGPARINTRQLPCKPYCAPAGCMHSNNKLSVRRLTFSYAGRMPDRLNLHMKSWLHEFVLQFNPCAIYTVCI